MASWRRPRQRSRRGSWRFRNGWQLRLRDYTTARERVAKYNEKILPAAKETLDLINAGYQQGQLEYAQVYNVQQTYANKNLSYLQDLETAWQRMGGNRRVFGGRRFVRFD